MLADVPIVFILVGIAAYTVLAGADFGAGFWTLFAGGGRVSRLETREHARHAMGPVWEANHVWIVFILVVCWTSYPTAFASITSTLAVPLFIAAVGIILRGASYALRGQLDEEDRGQRAVENLFALSSVLTPFALGTVVGGIASDRVPVGNARGDLLTSWVNPTSVMIGVLGVATGAYLAAVYLAADARRIGRHTLELDFRARALWAGVFTGALALGGLAVARSDAPRLWDGLTDGAGLAMVIVSATAGVATIVLVWRSLFTVARASAALAVAAIVAGWGFAQRPYILPGLTVSQAAAGRTALIAVIVSVAVGAIVLVPSLALLFRLFLRGRLDWGAPSARFQIPVRRRPSGEKPRPLRAALTLVTLLAGVGLMVFTDAGWMHAIGIIGLVVAAVSAFAVAAVRPESE